MAGFPYAQSPPPAPLPYLDVSFPAHGWQGSRPLLLFPIPAPICHRSDGKPSFLDLRLRICSFMLGLPHALAHGPWIDRHRSRFVSSGGETGLPIHL